jgi:hypothetical protein
MALSATQRDFVASAYAAARAAGLSGVQADLAVSQAIHESAWGTRPSGTNNVHGIKGKGSSVQTHEIEGGRRVNQRASFRNFGSMTESFRAWKGLMERKFSAVMNANTLPEAVKALKAGKQGGYATDPHYDNKVKAIANTVTRMPLAPPSLVAGLGDAPIPSSRPEQSLMASFDRAPIPPGLPSVARPDNMMASGPSFPRQVMTAGTMPAPVPSPERFGSRGSGASAPVMAGFAPDPSRFGRTPMAPPAPATGGRVGSGSFSAPPDPARFGPPPSAPSPAFRMAPPDVPDPARLGQIAMGPPGMMAARQATWGPGGMSIPAFPTSALPSNPGELGGIRMSNPVGLGGPGGLHMPPPQAAPVQPQVQPAAPQLPPPVTVQDYPVAEVGAPPMVPQAPRPTSGNTVETDQFGNRSVTNKFGATTISGPGGNQSAGSLPNSSATNPSAYAAANSAINSAINSAGIPQIPGPLGNPFSGILGEGQPQGFGKTLGGGLLGARMGMMGGLPGMAVGGILGSLLGRELSKPGGGRLAPLASALGIGQQRFATGFPAAPAAPPRSFQPMTEAQHRDFLNSPGIRESAQAQSAISRGGGGLY